LLIFWLLSDLKYFQFINGFQLQLIIDAVVLLGTVNYYAIDETFAAPELQTDKTKLFIDPRQLQM
jgi:hypothetical protein